ncbi:NAD(P)/FAD-dependent oxidoreductase [Thermoanaerobacterium sp. DL9XJH110]|uniref:NAD(P)/FAD-dependent oxidoreductase n=1 Tax=Thermoanaerobacterium sp. DL9XJH110 TaxID=3386643 RepID=UPI003BB7C899
MTYDVIIIGKGPAGLSASIYTARGGLKTLVIGRQSALEEGKVIENYCCAPQVSGEELLRSGIEQARKFGVKMVEEEVLDIGKDELFRVKTDANEYRGRAIIIATGRVREKIPIQNMSKFEGRGVHYCVTCDGFFYRNKKVGILGYKDYAVHELSEMQSFTKDVTLFTNGRELQINDTSKNYLEEKKIKVDTRPIMRLEGGELLEKIVFEDGRDEEINGLFVAYGSASSVDFALKLGILTENNYILVDRDQRTNVEGVFAAGDCTGGLAQVATAVGEGAVAGQSARAYVMGLSR